MFDIVAPMKSARSRDIFLLGKIEPVEREGDCGTELLFEPIALRESLQVDDQDLGKPVERISLRAFSSRLASFARWHLVAVKHLLLCERIEAVEEGDLASSCRDPKTEIPERLERDRLVRALRTPQSGLELANKQVDKLRVVATNVTLPRFHCLLAHAEAAVDLAVDRGRLRQHLEFKKAQCQKKRRQNPHPVDVFMESLEQIAEELLTVLLVVAAETRGEPAQLCFTSLTALYNTEDSKCLR